MMDFILQRNSLTTLPRLTGSKHFFHVIAVIVPPLCINTCWHWTEDLLIKWGFFSWSSLLLSYLKKEDIKVVLKVSRISTGSWMDSTTIQLLILKPNIWDIVFFWYEQFSATWRFKKFHVRLLKMCKFGVFAEYMSDWNPHGVFFFPFTFSSISPIIHSV